MNVVLYSTGCPKCNVLTKKLEQKGIAYEHIDDINAMTRLGIMEVPILSVDGELMDFQTAIGWVNKQ